jgi:hypothetical protein
VSEQEGRASRAAAAKSILGIDFIVNEFMAISGG